MRATIVLLALALGACHPVSADSTGPKPIPPADAPSDGASSAPASDAGAATASSTSAATD